MPSKLLQLISKLPCLRRKERDIESSYYKNLRKLLEELIASCDRESNSIHCYSAGELMRATDNFHPSRFVKSDPWDEVEMFRGFLDGRSIFITKYMIRSSSWLNVDEIRSAAIRDIAISVQMSTHENVLKLLGCCLELPIPALVHEYASKGVLHHDGSLTGDKGRQLLLPWNTRLRIAKQIASAVTYLHTALPRPIIYRDLTPHCIFLDDDYTPKLSHFSHSITIPPNQLDVEDVPVHGILPYIDPVYLCSSRISEKSDVYSFGVILLVLFTGKNARSFVNREEGYNSIFEYVESYADEFETILGPKILEEVGGDEQVLQQLHDFLQLALSCTQYEIERRPYMTDVARELIRIDESTFPS
ncbi:non-functional pseudokinase ZED1-like [Pyrus communis]|uniref:non-functional pseudokinase ZED1-like n=1 Tax=Pyrus communis TaxID=23211 RepID=UPI0035C17FF3